MTDVDKKATRHSGRAALKRWSLGQRSLQLTTLTLMSAATVSWAGFAWGIGAAVEDIANGAPYRLPLAAAGLFLLLRIILIHATESFSNEAGRRITTEARSELLHAISRHGARFLGGAGSGERVSQIVDRTHALFGYAARWTPGMRMALVGPVIVLSAAFMQSWLAGALLLGAVLTLPLFIWMTASGTAAMARAQQASMDVLSDAFQARAQQAGMIRAFRAVDRETDQLSTASEELRRHTMRILRTAFLTTAVVEFFASISIALVAVYVGFKLLGVFPFETGESITLKEGMTVLILAPEFFAPIRRLSTLHHDRADGAAAAEKIASWLESPAPASRRIPKLPHPPVLQFENLSLTHDGETDAVANVDMTADPGSITVLWGPSGSGKTSLLLSLIGSINRLSGRIFVDGEELAPDESLAESVAWLRQTPWASEASIADNIALASPGVHRTDVELAAERAGVTKFAQESEQGLDRPLGRFGAGLSGGQRQRLALARAILRDAPIWLMDEPTAHLDPDLEADFLIRIKQLCEGRTVIIATHSPAVAAIADKVVDLTKKETGKC